MANQPYQFMATVLGITPEGRPFASIRYRRDDGRIGTVMAGEKGYGPDGYWPPAEGDIIEVTPGEVVLILRPRGGNKP